MIRQTANQLSFIGTFLFSFVVAWSGVASAETPSFGASLGAVFPADRLSARTDELGSSLYPGPAVGVYGRFGVFDALPQVSWEAMAELALFQSDEDPGLRLIYVPVQFAGIWEFGQPGGMGMQVRAGIGPSFVSANKGETRALVMPGGSLGWRVETGFRNLDCAMEAGAEVLMRDPVQSMLRFRILLFTR